MAYPLAMTKQIQEEWTSSIEGGPKLLSSWPISEFLVDYVYFGASSTRFSFGSSIMCQIV